MFVFFGIQSTDLFLGKVAAFSSSFRFIGEQGKITGPIPESVGNLASLEHLYDINVFLSFVIFSFHQRTIGYDIFFFQFIFQLCLTSHLFSVYRELNALLEGTIPESLSKLTKLETLYDFPFPCPFILPSTFKRHSRHSL